MQFQPRRHPGHIDRKATECALAIVQPWAADHAYDAIRDALTCSRRTGDARSPLQLRTRPPRVADTRHRRWI